MKANELSDTMKVVCEDVQCKRSFFEVNTPHDPLGDSNLQARGEHNANVEFDKLQQFGHRQGIWDYGRHRIR
jgi:hypothetical protein